MAGCADNPDKRRITDAEVDEFCEMLKRANEQIEHRAKIKRDKENDRWLIYRQQQWRWNEWKHRKR